MDDYIGFQRQLAQALRVENVAFHLAHPRIVVERRKRNRLVMEEAVKKYQFVVFHQALGQVGTDETRAAGNENGLVSDSYAFFLGRFLRDLAACSIDAVSVGFCIAKGQMEAIFGVENLADGWQKLAGNRKAVEERHQSVKRSSGSRRNAY